MVEVNPKHLLLRLFVMLLHIMFFGLYIYHWLNCECSMAFAFKSVSVSWLAASAIGFLTLYTIILFAILLIARKVILYTFIRATMSVFSFIVVTLTVTCHDDIVIFGYVCWAGFVLEVLVGRAANHGSQKVESTTTPKQSTTTPKQSVRTPKSTMKSVKEQTAKEMSKREEKWKKKEKSKKEEKSKNKEKSRREQKSKRNVKSKVKTMSEENNQIDI
ncbi:hypothetical protein QR680_009702 [Steinernema hermaphroditum]|uniref:Uncharacterized protein n=1 Tax=Steinernema hermaphroditum TaxID=289476 RepID=A0AA39MAF7_9BILA|nr:hypothetical protein QR680_009702 [Steinernema hermaphroditum]